MTGLMFPKGEALAVTRERKRRAKLARDSRERTKVRARDGEYCRCCKTRKARDAHEIQFRSKGGRVRTANSVHLCRTCHALIQAHLIIVLGNDANGELHFVRKP